MAGESESGGTPGPATDRLNAPVRDPSGNVLDLVEAAIKRQDDLRAAESRHSREILGMRSDCAERVSRLEAALADEKFAGVQRMLALGESHRIELKDDSGKALTAALAAAEKAVSEQNKSATLSVDRAVAGMKELIINNQQVNQATTNALGDKVEDLKASVAVIVNTRIGATEAKTESRSGLGTVGLLVGSVVGILGLVIAAVSLIIATR